MPVIMVLSMHDTVGSTELNSWLLKFVLKVQRWINRSYLSPTLLFRPLFLKRVSIRPEERQEMHLDNNSDEKQLTHNFGRTRYLDEKR